MKIKFKIYYWPGLISVWFLLTFLLSYLVLKTQDNAPPAPYVSELGAWLPSSCVFGQMMNIAGLLVGITVYLRYRQVDLAIKTNTTSLNKKWNELGKKLGYVIALGVSIVGNFQGNVDISRGILVMHLIGALMAFGIGGMFLLVQLKITFDLRPYYVKFSQFGVSKFIQYFRLIAVIAYFINIIMVAVFIIATPRESNGYRVQGLLPGEDGYGFRLVSVITEWNITFIFLLIILTFTNELKVITFAGIHFKRIQENDEIL